jgi:hypothetical protein
MPGHFIEVGGGKAVNARSHLVEVDSCFVLMKAADASLGFNKDTRLNSVDRFSEHVGEPQQGGFQLVEELQ